MQIITKDISFTLPKGKQILHNINFSIGDQAKAALVGDNGTGKSTLLRIASGTLSPQKGSIKVTGTSWFIPQHYGQFDSLTVAEALQIHPKITALQAIENGLSDPSHFETLSEDWTIHERLQNALSQWGLFSVQADTPFRSLSGGQKTRVFLAGIELHHPDILLMDEPTNHLDRPARQQLYHFIRQTSCTLLIVSHDRELLELCNPIHELSSAGMQTYGGNYSFYEEQKQIETEALEQKIEHTKKEISAARKAHRETMQRKQKMDAQSARKGKTANLPPIVKNARGSKAENSASRLKVYMKTKINTDVTRLQQLSKQRKEAKQIRVSVGHSPLHSGKILFEAKRMNVAYPDSDMLWNTPLSFVIRSGERIRITGKNGSGKSTLIRTLHQQLKPAGGELIIQTRSVFLLDQEYRLIGRERTVLEQAKLFNENQKPDHELKTVLVRFLFDPDTWDQPCCTLSGGEMMRLSLCCLILQSSQPDVIMLDEPANNLDLRNIRILTDTIAAYQGTLIVVSHDEHFIREIGIDCKLHL